MRSDDTLQLKIGSTETAIGEFAPIEPTHAL